MNLLQFLTNVASEDAFVVESVSPDKTKIRFENGKIVYTKHLSKVAEHLKFNEDFTSFTLKPDWRQFEDSRGVTFFTNKEQKELEMW